MFSVNGGWGAWTSWSKCGENCQRTRSRSCNNPAPVNGGRNCVGDRRDATACSGGNCNNRGKGEHFIITTETKYRTFETSLNGYE